MMNSLEANLLNQLLVYQKEMEKKINALMTKLRESKRQKMEEEVEIRKLYVIREMMDVIQAVEQNKTQAMPATMSQIQPRMVEYYTE